MGLCPKTEAGRPRADYRGWVSTARLSRIAPELALATALLAAVAVEFHRRLDLSVLLAASLVAMPISIRLIRPVVAAAVAVGGLIWFAHTRAVSPDGFPIAPVVAWGLVLWAVGSRCRPRTIVLTGIASLAGWAVAVGLAAPAGHLAAGGLFIGCGLLIGRAMGILQFESDTFADEAARLVRERDEWAEQAVRAERRRIARELHDVISHSISVMGIQAGAVRTVLRPDQVREAEALLQVEQTGRETIAEMARLLGLLRNDGSNEEASTQGLGRADRLVRHFQEAGLDVHLTVGEELGHLAAGVDLAGYRILQEALTNILKHAPRAHAAARVTRTANTITIHVVDDGDGHGASVAMTGHGLLGMRERAELYGGKLTARPRPEGGFEVRATIPVTGQP